MNWIISANSRMYDHSSSFEHYGSIDWRQGNAKFEVGDVVYIYCTRPLMMLQYKCIVERINLNSSEIRDDKEYWLDDSEYYKALDGKFMTLRLLEQVSNHHMTLKMLKENGLKAAPQGPVRIKDDKLLKHIETYFTDSYQTDFFPDILNEEGLEYEGAKKTVVVNKYERSSKARENAVSHHGLDCVVCKMNFEKVYGKIGEGFIHIHHLTPIHEVGENYKIDYKNDLVPVCPNCHAMLHRSIGGREPSIEELRKMMKM